MFKLKVFSVIATVKYSFTLFLYCFKITENQFYSLLHFNAPSLQIIVRWINNPIMAIPVFNTGVIFMIVFIKTVFHSLGQLITKITP